MISKKKFEKENMRPENSGIDEFFSYGVMDCEGNTVYSVEDEGRTLVFDVVESVLCAGMQSGGLTDAIVEFIGCNRPDSCDKIDCLILKSAETAKGPFVIDAERLLNVFPNLATVLYNDAFRLLNAENKIYTLSPFEIGEAVFYLEEEGDHQMASSLWRDLCRLDSEWEEFFRKVLEDYHRKPEEHITEFDEKGAVICGGMDDLFRIYFFGWFTKDAFFDKENTVSATRYKNFDKAMELLSARFQNCTACEVGEKLFWDIHHMKQDENPDYERFVQVLLAAEKPFPEVRKSLFEIACRYGCEKDSFFLKVNRMLD